MATRTYGLSGSGFDVDAQVKALMKAQRARYDKVWQQKTQVEWKKQDYNNIFNLVKDFRDNTLYNFKKQSNLSPKLVSSTNDAVVSATANADAINVEHSIVVKQVADGVKLTSSGSITPAGNYKGSLNAQFGIAIGSTLDFAINGTNISVDVTDTASIYDVVDKINQSGAGVKASYDATIDRFFLYSDKSGSTAAVNFNGTGKTGMDFLFNTLKLGNFSSGLSTLGMVSRQTFADASVSLGNTSDLKLDITTDNGTPDTITVSAGATVQDLLDAVNAKLGAGAATFDATTQRINIKSVDINHGYTIDGNDAYSKSFFKDTLGMLQLTQNGHDASINLDGVDLTQASNTFTIAGVTYNIKAKSLTNPGDGSYIPTNVTVKPDIEKTIDAVQSFVDMYNTFVSTINTELTETRNRDFLPLTDDQKSSMKDSDITAYTNKAKSGMLRNDTVLSSVINNMRLNFISPVKGLSGSYTSASSIGIKTGSYVDDKGNINSEMNNGGKLYVDVDGVHGLRKALENDPDVVYKIFGTVGDTTETQGVAKRLYDQMDAVRGQLREQAGVPNTTDTTSNLYKSLKDYNTRLDTMNKQLKSMEERYYKQFDAMETAINRLNQQSSWLSQQFSSK